MHCTLWRKRSTTNNINKKNSGIKELEVFEALLLVRSILKNGGGACEAGGMYVCML